MIRKLRPISLNVNGLEFEKLYKLCNSMFPRHKHKWCLKCNGNYNLYWDLSDNEFEELIQEYTMIRNEVF